MKLYYFHTPNARKACALAKHLDSPVQYVLVDLTRQAQRDPAYLAINPNGKVPALVEEGRAPLWESNAILIRLAEKAGSPMWPEAGPEREEVLRWLFWESAHFCQATGRLFFENIVKRLAGMGEPDAAVVAAATAAYRDLAAVLDTHLRERDWLAGKTMTVADFSVAAILPAAREARIPLEEFPEIRGWLARLDGVPAWKAPFPEAMPT